ncbi:MAG: HEAT repeat domain-containing protein [Leptospiraceae bacterium]|nr:HEAT repeat domain-containing protein [Leptospiraceae bacterium]MDW7976970.1 HEAT repeat domain-containing protein [Leptospiraceae bacterium]
MKKLLVVFTLILSFTSLVPSDKREIIEFYEKLYDRLEKDLENGSLQEKLNAIHYMASLRRFRFVRPLSRELLRGLDDPQYRKMATFDPYVKSAIAHALGEIGRKEAIPPLAKALEIVGKIIEEERKLYQDNIAKAQQTQSPELFYERNEIAPAMLSDKYIFPTSPEAAWSIADDFKKFIAINLSDEWVLVRMRGYNYVNLAFFIIQAIGNIRSFEGVDPIAPFLSHPYKDLRLSTALALAKIGSPKAIEILEKRYQEETDDQVKARIAFAILFNDNTKGQYYRALMQFLRHPDPIVRYDVASAFRELSLGESYYELSDAFLIEDNPIVKKVLQQAINNAYMDNLFPPNPILDTGPTRIWIYGDPYAPKEPK